MDLNRPPPIFNYRRSDHYYINRDGVEVPYTDAHPNYALEGFRETRNIIRYYSWIGVREPVPPNTERVHIYELIDREGENENINNQNIDIPLILRLIIPIEPIVLHRLGGMVRPDFPWNQIIRLQTSNTAIEQINRQRHNPDENNLNIRMPSTLRLTIPIGPNEMYSMGGEIRINYPQDQVIRRQTSNRATEQTRRQRQNENTNNFNITMPSNRSSVSQNRLNELDIWDSYVRRNGRWELVPRQEHRRTTSNRATEQTRRQRPNRLILDLSEDIPPFSQNASSRVRNRSNNGVGNPRTRSSRSERRRETTHRPTEQTTVQRQNGNVIDGNEPIPSPLQNASSRVRSRSSGGVGNPGTHSSRSERRQETPHRSTEQTTVQRQNGNVIDGNEPIPSPLQNDSSRVRSRSSGGVGNTRTHSSRSERRQETPHRSTEQTRGQRRCDYIIHISEVIPLPSQNPSIRVRTSSSSGVGNPGTHSSRSERSRETLITPTEQTTVQRQNGTIIDGSEPIPSPLQNASSRVRSRSSSGVGNPGTHSSISERSCETPITPTEQTTVQRQNENIIDGNEPILSSSQNASSRVRSRSSSVGNTQIHASRSEHRHDTQNSNTTENYKIVISSDSPSTTQINVSGLDFIGVHNHGNSDHEDEWIPVQREGHNTTNSALVQQEMEDPDNIAITISSASQFNRGEVDRNKGSGNSLTLIPIRENRGETSCSAPEQQEMEDTNDIAITISTPSQTDWSGIDNNIEVRDSWTTIPIPENETTNRAFEQEEMADTDSEATTISCFSQAGWKDTNSDNDISDSHTTASLPDDRHETTNSLLEETNDQRQNENTNDLNFNISAPSSSTSHGGLSTVDSGNGRNEASSPSNMTSKPENKHRTRSDTLKQKEIENSEENAMTISLPSPSTSNGGSSTVDIKNGRNGASSSSKMNFIPEKRRRTGSSTLMVINNNNSSFFSLAFLEGPELPQETNDQRQNENTNDLNFNIPALSSSTSHGGSSTVDSGNGRNGASSPSNMTSKPENRRRTRSSTLKETNDQRQNENTNDLNFNIPAPSTSTSHGGLSTVDSENGRNGASSLSTLTSRPEKRRRTRSSTSKETNDQRQNENTNDLNFNIPAPSTSTSHGGLSTVDSGNGRNGARSLSNMTSGQENRRRTRNSGFQVNT
ncbi:Hypothetical protein CINCED_3A002506 [Cinara cedri]|uniref:Uncharacterized protein n=1 Tax=Cinara cedri TaxID=506608 RepID=A0A5E4NCL7_9HEMI|nr:Hypothetical protein CINCED_3A002506 [Cinara cedri]